MGGLVSVQSKLGQATQFSIILSLKTQSLAKVSEAQEEPYTFVYSDPRDKIITKYTKETKNYFIHIESVKSEENPELELSKSVNMAPLEDPSVQKKFTCLLANDEPMQLHTLKNILSL